MSDNVRRVTACDLMVTGAAGFVGTHVLQRATAAGLETAALEGDVRDGASVARQLAEAAPRAIIHLASPPRTPESHAADVVAGELAMAASLLVAAATQAPDTVILFTGTAAQYGRGLPRLLSENDPTEPLSAYGHSKSLLERVVTDAAFNEGVRVIFTRSFNHVGPGQSAGAPVADWASQVAAAEQRGGGTLVTGRLDVVRDFLDVRDVADAYLALVRAGEPGVVNVCSGRGTPLEDVAGELAALCGTSLELVHDPALDRPDDPPHVVGDPSRLRELTGFEPRVPLRQSLEDTLAEWRAAVGAPRSDSVEVAQ